MNLPERWDSLTEILVPVGTGLGALTAWWRRRRRLRKQAVEAEAGFISRMQQLGRIAASAASLRTERLERALEHARDEATIAELERELALYRGSSVGGNGSPSVSPATTLTTSSDEPSLPPIDSKALG